MMFANMQLFSPSRSEPDCHLHICIYLGCHDIDNNVLAEGMKGIEIEMLDWDEYVASSIFMCCPRVVFKVTAVRHLDIDNGIMSINDNHVQIFFYFLVVTSIVVAGQLILGGSAVINALTGMHCQNIK